MSELPPGFVLDQPAPAAVGGLPPGFVLDQPTMLQDVGKSAPAGLANAVAGVVGMGGDVRDLASRGVDALGAKTGVDFSALKSGAHMVSKMVPGFGLLDVAPTSHDVQQGIENTTGITDYQPQTFAGSVTKKGFEFLPSLIGGPEGLVTRGLTQVAAPALASAAAGKLTEGTDAQPYAELAGALAGGVGASAAARRMAAASAARAAGNSLPDAAEIKAAARSQYQHPEVQAIQIKPQAVADLADTIATDLQHGTNSGFRAANEPKVFSAIEELKNAAAEKRPATIADLDSVRQVLGNAAKEKDITGQMTRQAVAASRAIDHIDNFIPNLKQPDLLAGNAARANDILDTARRNWGAAKRSELVQTTLANAQVNAASSHSGANIQNATKQAFKPFMKNDFSKARGFNDAEKDALEKIVRGTWTGSAARAAGNLLGGGGGLGMLASGAAGYEAGGVPGAVAMGLAGRGLKMIGNRSTFNAVQKLDKLIRSRAPEAVKLAAQNPQYVAVLPSKSQLALRSMILSDPTLRAQVSQPIPQQRETVGQTNP